MEDTKTETPLETAPKPLAILFTNAGGRVVFANRNFLQLSEESASRAVAGERLETVLSVDPQSVEKIITILVKGGMIDRVPVTLTTASGKSVPVLLSGTAAYGAKGDYIGADICLHHQFTPAAPDSPTIPSLKHTGVLRIYTAEVFSGTRTRGQTFIQAYVVAQVEVLQILLARMGGSEARNTLERTVNEVITGYAAPAQMTNGYLEFFQKSIDISIYRTVLQAAIHYARTAIGQRMVGQEMLKVDSQMDTGLLHLLTQMDLRPTLTLG